METVYLFNSTANMGTVYLFQIEKRQAVNRYTGVPYYYLMKSESGNGRIPVTSWRRFHPGAHQQSPVYRRVAIRILPVHHRSTLMAR